MTRQAAFDLSDPTPGRCLARRAGHRPAARRADRRRPLPQGPGRQPACLSPRPARLRLEGSAGDERGRSPTSSPSSRRCGSSPRHQPPIPSSFAAPTSTASAACPRPTRPAPSWPTAIPANGRRLIDRLLDRPEFADFWALKWADLLRNEEKTMGSKGVWVFQRWLRDQIAADVPLDEMVRKIVAARGSTWTNPPVELPPDQPRPDDRGRDRRPGLSRHPAPVRTVPQPPVRRLDPGRLLRPGRLLLERRAQGCATTSAGTSSTSTRSTATRSST